MTETRPTRRSPGAVLLLVLLLGVVPAAAYVPALAAPFHYDDLHSIQRNPHLKLHNALNFFRDPGLFDENPATRMYRPVLLLTYAVDDFFWGRNPLGFRITNVLVHLLAGAVLFALLAALLAPRPGPIRFRAAVIGALAFLLHPLATESVTYVSCRSNQLATLGYLAALLGYLRARRAPPGAGVAAGWLAFALFGALVAFGSKAIAITLPVALGLVELLAVRRAAPGARGMLLRAGAWLLPFVLLAGGYLLVRQEVMGSTGVNLTAQRFLQGGHELTGGRSVQSNLLTQATVFWRYVGLMVWPVRLNVAHHAALAHSLGETRVWLSLLGLVGYLGVALLCLRRRWFRVGLALVWLPLALSPTSSIVPLNVVMSENRLYLPLTLSVGLLAAAGVAAALPAGRLRLGARPGLAVAAAVVLGVWGVRAGWRNADYRDGERLWAKAVAVAPENFRARNHLGNALAERGDFRGARAQYRAAREIYPEYFDTLLNLGEANLRVADAGEDCGAWDEGEQVLRELVAREPRHVLARLKLGRLLFQRAVKLGDRPEDLEAAAVEFRTVIEMARAPRFQESRIWAWSRIAALEEHRGDLAAAVRACRAILAEMPYHAEARAHLAALRARLAGRAAI
ncbi:MAG: hypothetical protein JXQ29_02555 [Planctomycetes bacterium]|nr:hypothetical protein [Planctomycetota bacterium]